MAFSDKLDDNIKALEKHRLPAGDNLQHWYDHLDTDTGDAKVANLAAWALALLPNEWHIAAITQGLTEDDLRELEAWIDDMVDTRRGIDGPSD